jgi:hypothetical protein
LLEIVLIFGMGSSGLDMLMGFKVFKERRELKVFREIKVFKV